MKAIFKTVKDMDMELKNIRTKAIIRENFNIISNMEKGSKCSMTGHIMREISVWEIQVDLEFMLPIQKQGLCLFYLF